MWIVPSAAAITRMKECFDWLLILDPEDARIVWLGAEGVRWRQVCCRAGVVRTTAWRRWAASLLTIAKHPKALEKPGRKAVTATDPPDPPSRPRPSTEPPLYGTARHWRFRPRPTLSGPVFITKPFSMFGVLP